MASSSVPSIGQAAVADVVAGGAVVDEPDDAVAEVAVLEQLVGDGAPEVAGPGNQHPLEADAAPPAPLEGLAHEGPRAVGEQRR